MFLLSSKCIFLRNFSSFYSVRCYSAQKGFVQKIIDKIKEETERDKEFKESIKKFRQETEKLEKSKELESVRDFYKKIEKEIPSDSVEKLRENLHNFKEKIKLETEELRKHEAIRKGSETLSKTTEQVWEATKSLSDSDVVKKAKEGVFKLDKELQSDRSLVYRPPEKLKKRNEIAGKAEEKIVEANTHASGVILHNDSKWFTAWQDFKENNEYIQKFFDIRAKYEESDNVVVRSVRVISDKVTGLFGGSGSKTELQTVLDEITKHDPSFSLDNFLRFCQFDVIPNVLEAIIHGNLEILKDWCHEAPYNILSQHFKQRTDLSLHCDSRVLDFNNLDVAMGRVMDQGPVLIITFQSQELHCWRDAAGVVRDGDPGQVVRVNHVWAMCRDHSELYPLAAWRVLEIAMMPADQWV